MSEESFIAGIKRFYLDDHIEKWSKRSILVLAQGNYSAAEKVIRSWEKKGFVKIIKPLLDCSENDYCFLIMKTPFQIEPYGSKNPTTP